MCLFSSTELEKKYIDFRVFIKFTNKSRARFENFSQQVSVDSKRLSLGQQEAEQVYFRFKAGMDGHLVFRIY